jgi:hypothetical protein
MKGVYVKRNPTIKLDLTADDWQLYDDDGGEYARRELVADGLCKGIEDILNCPETPKEDKIRRCYKLLDYNAKYGAADSEGCAVLHNILCEFYGRWDYHEEEVL